MQRILLQILVTLCLGVALAGCGAQAHEISVDTTAARQVLAAVQKAGLTEAEARAVAELPGNQALIKKQAEFGNGGTEQRFVEEMLAAANNLPLNGRPGYYFSGVRKRAAAIGRVLDAIEQDKAGFIASIDQRIAPYSPRGANYRLSGLIIAGGDASGFTFGGTTFYLNLDDYADDLETARLIMAHELYHAVQGAAVDAAGLHGQRGYDETRYAGLTGEARKRYVVESFLYELLTEGTAIYVGDPALMTADTRMAKMERERLQLQNGRLDRLATQLDASLLALTHETPIAWDPIYALGFYGPDQPLYYLGYAMSKAMVEKSGPGRLGELAAGSGCEFAQAYLDLRTKDASLPPLGPSTVQLVKKYCH